MNLEFKFSNEVNASVCIATKTIKPYTVGIDGERYPFYGPIEFNDDTSMVYALNDIANKVNISQHDDVVDLIFKHLKGCSISYINDGGIEIRKTEDADLYDIGGFYESIQHSFDEYTIKEEGGFDVFAYNLTDINGRRIATIYR